MSGLITAVVLCAGLAWAIAGPFVGRNSVNGIVTNLASLTRLTGETSDPSMNGGFVVARWSLWFNDGKKTLLTLRGYGDRYPRMRMTLSLSGPDFSAPVFIRTWFFNQDGQEAHQYHLAGRRATMADAFELLETILDPDFRRRYASAGAMFMALVPHSAASHDC